MTYRFYPRFVSIPRKLYLIIEVINDTIEFYEMNFKRIKTENVASKNPYLIGVTGGFGTGKSLVGSILKDAGVFVIDTDDIVKDLLKTNNDTTKKIVNEFGNNVCNFEGAEYISRKKLADIVFNDVAKRKKLEAIIHPMVERKIKDVFS